MPWNSVSPNPAQSVADNLSPMQQNTAYIKATMGSDPIGENTDVVRDHFWNVDSTLDGRHRFIQSPAFTVGGLPDDPIIGSAMNQVIYAKLKTAVESVAQQDVQPFARCTKTAGDSSVSSIMQLLGIRACVLFNGDPATILYKHNVLSVVRTAEGRYTVTFDVANPLPSDNYLVLGGAFSTSGNTASTIDFFVQTAATVATVKTTTFVKVMTKKTSSNEYDDAEQVWLICFGG